MSNARGYAFSMNAKVPMPAAFIGHGSPMNTLETNAYTAAWRALGESMPRPKAILAISAHWYVNGTAVTAMASPKTIHDFGGFPPALHAVQYPAPGSPELAQRVADVLAPEPVILDRDAWGLDHGTWSVLVHVFPKADIPVVQLSINGAKPPEWHLEVGRKLAPLREEGVFIVASGNVVHNLRRIDFQRPDFAYDWALRFDGAVKEIMTSEPARLAEAERHPDYALAVPTPDHFLPLYYIAGLADAARKSARAFSEGSTLGSISMTGYVVE